MKLVSWNLNGLEDKHLDERTEAAMFQILLGAPIEKALQQGFKPNTPDIVLLQEVVPRSYHAHIVPHLKAAGFHIFPESPTERSYFEIIAVKSPILETAYTTFSYTDQGRGLSSVRIDDLLILTAHMESQKPGKPMRIDQANQIFERMQMHPDASIFAGDTNLRKSEWISLQASSIKDDIRDAWISAGSPQKHKTTWQRDAYKSRYDRAWTRNVKIINFETFGHNKVATINERPSDHYAIRLEF